MNAQTTPACQSFRGATVLDSAACFARLGDLTTFENQHFGEGFAWSAELNQRWASSSAALHAAIMQDTITGRIVAAMSILLVHPDSCEQLLAGRIRESDLQPWNEGSPCRHPIIYFASVIATSRADLPLLYESLACDSVNLLQQHNLRAEEGLAIASGEAGRRHLERNGFRPLGNARYLHQYTFMKITARHAQTPFWRQVLTVRAEVTAHPLPRPIFSTGSPFPA